MRYARWMLIFAALFMAGHGAATEVLNVSVEKRHGVYYVAGTSIVHAPADYIFEQLLDYDNFYKISNGIAETRFVVDAASGEELGYTRIEACVLFFCRSAEKLEHIDAIPFREIITESIPERSDFRINNSRWTLIPEGDATRLSFESEFRPDFWMPPLIGPWAIRRELTQTAETIGQRLEYLYEHGLTLAQIGDTPAAE